MNFTINLPIIIGIIFLVISFIAHRHPSRKINLYYGYRTKRSMKNQENWNYAQSLLPRSMAKAGMGMILLGIVLWLIDSSQPVIAIAGILSMFITIISLFIITELKLKRFESSNASNTKA